MSLTSASALPEVEPFEAHASATNNADVALTILPFPARVRARDMLSLPDTFVGRLAALGYVASMAAVVYHNAVGR